MTPEGDTVTHYQIRGVDFGRHLVSPAKKYRLQTEEDREKAYEQYRIRQKERLEERIHALRKKTSAQSPSRSTLSYAVGDIPLSSGVSPSGARTYQIPINTAPGISFAPSLSLVYNSQGGDGIAGYGWELSGISSISLINKNVYYHGEAKAADVYNTSDPAFALDGIPIVPNDDPATSQTFPYATARGHILVSRQVNVQGVVQSFTVLYPNGNKGVFSAVVSEPSHNQISYPLTHLENLQQDSIVFRYNTGVLHFERTPISISYGHDPSGNPQATIYFSYTSRSDHVTRFFAGEEVYRASLLSRIESRNGLHAIQCLDLTHQTYDSVPLLTQVDCSSGSEQLPPLCFTYDAQALLPGQRDTLEIAESAHLSGNYDAVDLYTKRGKFLRNRYNDGIASYPVLPTYDAIDITGVIVKKRKYGSPYPDDQPILVAPRINNETSAYNNILSEDGFQTAEPVDVDGDGVDEIVRVNFGESTSSGSPLLISVYKCSASGYPSLQYSFSVTLQGVLTEGNFKSPYRRQYFWGDFNGNGKAELLTIAHDKNSHNKDQVCYAALIDIAGRRKVSEEVLFNFTQAEDLAGKVFTADFDGDTRTELCRATSDGLQIWRLGTNSRFSLEKTISDMLLSNLQRPFFVTDLNGDGYLDAVKAPNTSTGSWTIYAYDGHDVQIHYLFDIPYSTDDRYLPIDVNRDGLADFVHAHGTVIDLYLNTDGYHFDSARTSRGLLSDTQGIAIANALDPSGMSAFIKIDGANVQEYAYPNLSPELRAISWSEDSRGRVTTNAYTYLPALDVAWTDEPTVDNASGFTQRLLPIHVLSQELSQTSLLGGETYKWMDYEYFDPIVHNLGLGFCGFSHIRTTDEAVPYGGGAISKPVRITDTYFDPQRMGVTTSVAQRLSSPHATPWTTTSYTYDDHATVHGKLSPRLVRTVTTDNRTGIGTEVNYNDYDSYDFPARIRTERHLAPDTLSTYEILSRTYTHSSSSSKYVLGVVTEESLVRERDGITFLSWKERDTIAYDALFRPVSRKHRVGQFNKHLPIADSLVWEKRWTYDSYGNVTSEKTAPYGAAVFTGDSYVYDSQGRYPVSKTDALGRTTTFSGYDKFGNPATSTDHKGRTTSFTYDAWGRLVQTQYLDGTVEQTATAWGGAGLYTVTRTATGEPESVTHYDALGREIRGGVKRFDGQWQYMDKEYDVRGRLYRSSLPYRGASPTLWNVYAYDDYDRPLSITEASGKVSTWSYSGTSTTTVRDGITSTSTTDAFGDVVQVVDGGGTIRYSLRDDGQPSTITAPGDIVTTLDYDGYGRRTAIHDPSAGTRTTQESRLTDGSSIIVSTNPNGSVTTHSDRFGRTTLVERSGAHNTAYTYGSDGLLQSVVSTNGASKAYTYDSFDRVATETDTVAIMGGVRWLRKTYTYGPGSVVASIKYTTPDGDITTETYTYANGHNTGITLPDGTAVWSLVSENDLGAPTQILSGDVTRQYGYTATGLPTYRKMGNPDNGGLGSLQHFTYQFDPQTGNLQSRSDVNHNQAESFGYDSLDRLVSINGRTVTYDNPTGNITAIGGVGTMTYGDLTQPYRMTGFQPVSSDIVSPYPQTVTYTSFDRPAMIRQGTDSVAFRYGCDGERVTMDVTGEFEESLLSWSRDYIGDRYECERQDSILIKEVLYLGGDAYSAPMALAWDLMNPDWTLYNIGRDYLGSITQVATADGTLIDEYSYDPWGRLRDPQTLSIYPRGQEPELLLGRGFTGHEHLPQFGLVNMNARLYDPLLGRFLYPDPYIQDPGFSQNYNRFAYVLNNPLKYSDESGQFVIETAAIIIATSALIGGVINLVVNLDNIDGFAEGATTFLSGAIGGALVSAVGALSGGVGWIALAGAGSGALTSFNNAIVAQTGKNFSGYNSLDWDRVWTLTAAGAISGAVSSCVGDVLTSCPITLNGTEIRSPVLKTMLIAPFIAASGHVAGGVSYGLLEGKDLEMALNDSYLGLEQSLIYGTFLGVCSTVASSYFNGVNPITGKMAWPKNGGFADVPESTTLPAGTEIDRYGNPDGYYAAPADTPFSERGLPKISNNPNNYSRYLVTSPIEVQSGTSSGVFWFGSQGGGVQYKFEFPLEYYLKNGYLIQIPK